MQEAAKKQAEKTTAPTLTRSQQKNVDILNAAEQVFIEKGFKGTSMDEIARVAQVSKRTVYNHFETKEALFHQILMSCCEELFFSNDLDYPTDMPIESQLYDFLQHEWDFFVSDRITKLTRIVIGEYVETPGFANMLINEFKERETSIYRWLRSQVDNGRLENINFEFAERYLIESIKAHAHYPRIYDQTTPEGDDRDYIVREIIALFLGRYATSN
ncbi:Transcriptional repressor Mce3R [BD1-7 clade bacterium]|uniref:Transcriptional repressor Mce3R n=1 Tax=BD1-7 clade bacterium TaxID=2029982 RepID=A0A5S9QP36_9GAMM|nr:Transcriptional repressor Mce3R [BD1-7 clade bacterium]CAA0116540.1 Transcriptional repressor Mce3R [BD1-7 clade bacterium]CAA0120167.1 Transcriptional repressor Mce3R [BD1-7 clade bacterium]